MAEMQQSVVPSHPVVPQYPTQVQYPPIPQYPMQYPPMVQYPPHPLPSFEQEKEEGGGKSQKRGWHLTRKQWATKSGCMDIYMCKACRDNFYAENQDFVVDETRKTQRIILEICNSCAWVNQRIRFETKK